ncbi:MAG: 4Fe-4S binding protein [Clostridia bacterium]|nr:4Fe-4S binding protein [Clostridia bacterium]
MNKVTFKTELCKGCGLCEEACPKKIVKLNPDKLNAKGYNVAEVSDEDMAKCIACAMCARMCPDCVITVEKN